MFFFFFLIAAKRCWNMSQKKRHTNGVELIWKHKEMDCVPVWITSRKTPKDLYSREWLGVSLHDDQYLF